MSYAEQLHAEHLARRARFFPSPRRAPAITEFTPKPYETGKAPAWKQIVRQVAKRHDVTVEAILGARGSRWVSDARHEAAWRIFTELRWSKGRVARALNRDRSTIWHSIQVYQRLMGREEAA